LMRLFTFTLFIANFEPRHANNRCSDHRTGNLRELFIF
jgi:hypothetical protein